MKYVFHTSENGYLTWIETDDLTPESTVCTRVSCPSGVVLGEPAITCGLVPAEGPVLNLISEGVRANFTVLYMQANGCPKHGKQPEPGPGTQPEPAPEPEPLWMQAQRCLSELRASQTDLEALIATAIEQSRSGEVNGVPVFQGKVADTTPAAPVDGGDA